MKWQTKSGKDLSEKIERLMLDAGSAGITRSEIASATGKSESAVKWYMTRLPFVYSANPRMTSAARVFHANHKADGAVYVDRINAQKKASVYLSDAAKKTIFKAIEDCGDSGATYVELRDMTGLAVVTMRRGVSEILSTFGVQLRRTDGTTVRLFGPNVKTIECKLRDDGSKTSVAAIVRLLSDKPKGMIATEIAEALGICRVKAKKRLSRLAGQGAIGSYLEPAPNTKHRARYFTKEHEATAKVDRVSSIERRSGHKTVIRVRPDVCLKIPKGNAQKKKVSASFASTDAIENESTVRQVSRPIADRFGPDERTEYLFSKGLGVGAYLPTGSHIERVYGGRT